MNKFSSPQFPPANLTPDKNVASKIVIGQSLVNGQLSNQIAQTKNTISFDPDLAAKIDALEKEQAQQRACPSCGAIAKQARLTCEMCGNYFERGYEESVWDKVDNRNPAKNGSVSDEEAQIIALKGYVARRVIAKTIDIVIVGSLITMEFISFFSLARAFGGVPQMAALMLGLLTYAMPVLVVLTIPRLSSRL